MKSATIRDPVVAGRFYPRTAALCHSMIDEFSVPISTPTIRTALGGIVPHAGWMYSGSIAATVFRTLKEHCPQDPETIILFGAVHVSGVFEAITAPESFWKTPLGTIPLDQELAQKLPFPQKKQAHEREHSIEVQVPFIQTYFPQSKILPIAVPPDFRALEVGKITAQLVKQSGKKVLWIGSSDLTHYGKSYYFMPKGEGFPALEWVKTENDARIIRLMTEFQTEQIISEADTHHNACGSGAITATLSAIRTLDPKAQAWLQKYTTSYEVIPEGIPDHFVGYAGILIGHA